jgi:hypothetical protein
MRHLSGELFASVPKASAASWFSSPGSADLNRRAGPIRLGATCALSHRFLDRIGTNRRSAQPDRAKRGVEPPANDDETNTWRGLPSRAQDKYPVVMLRIKDSKTFAAPDTACRKDLFERWRPLCRESQVRNHRENSGVPAW